MPQNPPITDAYIDEIIKAPDAYNPTLNKTQGVKLRELIRYIPNTGIIIPFLTYQKDYDELNKDGQIISREHQFKKESERLEKLIANHKQLDVL